MINKKDNKWKVKLHVRLHSPAQSAMTLMQEPKVEEAKDSEMLCPLDQFYKSTNEISLNQLNGGQLHSLAFDNDVIKPSTFKIVQQADRWATAADRPQWTMENSTTASQGVLTVTPWAQANWMLNKDRKNNALLIHPLTGDKLELSGELKHEDIADIKQRVFHHFSQLLIRHNGQTDYKKTSLAMWRFGPEFTDKKVNNKMSALWDLLPADTRVPDQSIWDHLDLTSAFAGAFAADKDSQVSLLSLSIGPVQSFISKARKMEDLWAGSHLLARLSWEAMRVVCAKLGPDAILFPRLRGIPQVDLWLRDEMELPDSLFENCSWNTSGTDSNPLFSAAIPNRFVAVIPESQVNEITDEIKYCLRHWLQNLGMDVVSLLLSEAGYSGQQESHKTPFNQMLEQLKEFPEIHWAAVPFSLIKSIKNNNQKKLDVSNLSGAMRPFFNDQENQGFLNTTAWKILQKEIKWNDNGTFLAPNPGMLYPAVHDLAERVLAASKSTHCFSQTQHHGWRCSMTGETEWLTTDRKQLAKSYRRQSNTLWFKIAQSKPAWAKKGEHLGGLSAIKRLWPTIYAEEVGKALAGGEKGERSPVNRFVVSTHTMALAHQMANNLEVEIDDDIKSQLKKIPRVALPRKLAKKIYKFKNDAELIARLPGWLEAAKESEQIDEFELVQNQIKKIFNAKTETYYALLLMDGDKMGAILSADTQTNTTISYRDSFHPKIHSGFDKQAQNNNQIFDYGQQMRALSPGRHLAISGALNDFSLTVARHVIEEEFLGKLIYAGGDDVFAMMPVADLLPAMCRLRETYSGVPSDEDSLDYKSFLSKDKNQLRCKNGFAYLNGRLMRMMGRHATASCGAVIAHHQAPLSAVRRELQLAEKRAKNEGGRNAFSITIIKRSGGSLYITDKWNIAAQLLNEFREFLTKDDVSRRAVYHTLEWLNDNKIPSSAFKNGQLKSLLSYQLERQTQGVSKQLVPQLAHQLHDLTRQWPLYERISKLRNFLSVAEFLARETRSIGESK